MPPSFTTNNRFQSNLKLVLAAAIALSVSSRLYAGPQQIDATGFNVFTFSSLQTSSDIQGSIAAGGAIGGYNGATNLSIGAQLPNGYTGEAVVTNTGITTGNFVQVSKGNAYVPNGKAGSNPSTANIHFNGTGALTTIGTDPIDFAGAQTYYRSLSSSLAGSPNAIQFQNPACPACTPFTGTITATQSTSIFTLTPGQYDSLNKIVTNGHTVIINVEGTSDAAIGSNNQNMQVYNTAAGPGSQNTYNSNDPNASSKVLFNFYQDGNASQFGVLTLPNVLGGSVLAPYATVEGNNQFNSTIIAYQLKYGGEIDSGNEFTGTLPSLTPEPAEMLPLLGLGGLLFFFYRRKRESLA